MEMKTQDGVSYMIDYINRVMGFRVIRRNEDVIWDVTGEVYFTLKP